MSVNRKTEAQLRRAIYEYLKATGLDLLYVSNLEARTVLSKWLEHAPGSVQEEVRVTFRQLHGWVTLIDVGDETTPELETARRKLLEILEQ